MTLLAGQLERLRDLAVSLKTRSIFPGNQARPTRLVLERVLKALDISPALPKDRMEQVKREIIAAQHRGADLSTLSAPLIRDAVWLLWPAADDGIERQRLLNVILSRVGDTTAILRRLLDAWLLHFSADDDRFHDVGRRIDRHLAGNVTGILANWKEINAAYDLFDAKGGPDLLASRLLGEASADVLTACRLDGPIRAKSGYLRATHFALSTRLPKLLSGNTASDALERAMRFYAPDGQLRFDKSEKETHGAMADALVAPWGTTQQRQPSEALESEVLTQLRLHLGDPRVDHERLWDGASQRTRQTVRSWLSKLSLDAFFDVVGRFAGNAGMGHQWQARKAFWGACLREGHIRDSWLVLGSNVARSVADNRELRGSYTHQPLPA
jgi:hypothetical protein